LGAKWVVTGAAGFIGSNIVRGLNERGITEILAVDVPASGAECRNLADLVIADYVEMGAFREGLVSGPLARDVAVICHQGACADTMVTDAGFMMARNFEYSRDLLGAALESGVPFVYASSASVYGTNAASKESPGNERPINVYARSKLCFDEHVREILPRAASTVVGLRYFNVYGPREEHKGRMASMPYQLWRQLTRDGVAHLFEGTDGYGDGEQRRDFVYVGDVVAANAFFVDRGPSRGIFNVGTGRARSFNEVARVLIDGLGSGRIEYIPLPEALAGKYQSFTEADLQALRETGYDRPFTSIEEGLRLSMEQWAAP